ncbi:calcium-activated chloride channel regulator 1 [Bombina bombina]|uniref:calcium-activated chloride channel regulator 1 n=1 Tax=Bombina bombina TaxID=8345 RepID=UPI00235A585F|nr:calcium-activated chloride channel regulator 1 [Bombina bombina]
MALQKVFALIVVILQALHASHSSTIKVNNGGYEDILIAIKPDVQENVKIVENIQDMVKEATSYLFKATKNKLFLRSVNILIPSTWSSKNYSRPKTETYDKADIIIANPYIKYGNDPYTLQYGGCGEPGKYIHLTPDFLLDDKLTKVYGPRGRVFVHEWAHLRWGVFDEYNNEVPYYITQKGKVEKTSCSVGITGTNKKQECNGASCKMLSCQQDSKSSLYEDGCVFIPDKNQKVKESIMYMQALPTVSEFCDASTHNIEAPNLQNKVCNFRSTWDIIVNSTDITSTPAKNDSNIPVPTFSLLQHKERIVTLVLDVSGSMGTYERIVRLNQAAKIFVTQIIETGSQVGIVTFSSAASIVSPLVQVLGQQQRDNLANLIPTVANGGTHICSGILMGLQVNKQINNFTYGTEIVLLTDGEDNFDTSLCFPDIKESGSIIHVIALGTAASKTLEQIAKMTGGLQYFATDKVDANGLIDAFSGITAANGNISQQAIQLESTALNLKPNECLNGTIFIDSAVGKETFFLVTWQSPNPRITLQDPNGKLYTTAQFISDTASRSSRLEIPGVAQSGQWRYSLCNSFTGNQVIGILVNSKAANDNIPPVLVNAHMNRDLNQFPSPMVVYASVSQGYLPVKGAKVTAIVESQSGNQVILPLFDNGAGADVIKNDGIYSRYFTNFTENGRYSLKIRVESRKDKTRLALRRSRAYYVPGYVEDGEIVMNPSKPVVSDEDLQPVLEDFSRTTSGGSFVVSMVPSGPQPDIYKPEKITDVEAKIENQTIVLMWTATGDDMDQGQATSYELRMSSNLNDLRENFDNSTSVNISMVTPQPAGSSEIFRFVPKDVHIANGTIFYFGLVAIDKASQRSDLSNIAQAALLIPEEKSPTVVPVTSITSKTSQSNGKMNFMAMVMIFFAATVTSLMSAV